MTTALAAPTGEVGVRLHQLRHRLEPVADRLEAMGARFALPALTLLSALVMLSDWASQVRLAGWFGTNGDGGYFASKGSILLGPHALTVYSDRTLQSGPWQLLAWRGLALLGNQRGSLLAGIVGVALSAAAVYLVVRWLLAGRTYRNVLSLSVAVLLVLWGPIPESYDSGHLAQIAIPLMWLVAAKLARDGRALPAGVVLGLTAGVETWGVLAAALILLLPGWRAKAVGAAATFGVVGATYLPFVASGSFAMFRMQWAVTNETLVHLVVAVGTPFTYQFRLVQVLAATILSAVVLLRTRRTTNAIWLAVALPVAVRLVLDAQVYDYYIVPVRVAGLVAVALLVSDRRWGPALWLLLATAFTFTNGLLPCWAPIVMFAVVAAAVGLHETSERARSMLRSGDLALANAQDSRTPAENH